MDAKLNHSDLSALLAKEAGLSLAKAEMLTKAVFDIIIEGLEQDGVVKISSILYWWNRRSHRTAETSLAPVPPPVADCT